MSTSIQRMARWARGLTIEAVPPPVIERIRLQQLSVAGAIHGVLDHPGVRPLRQVHGGGRTALLATGGRASRRDAVALHVALAGLLEFGDDVLFTSPGGVALPVAWAWARGRRLDEILVAALAGQEIAARIGAALLLGPEQDLAAPLHAAVAAAVVAGLLEGLDEDELAQAIALATLAPGRMAVAELWAGVGSVSTARGAVAGVDAAVQARAGLRGPVATLDDHGGVLETWTPVPLRAAFTGLGRTWLTSTLTVRPHPGARHLQTPVQAVWEILRRHVKAADKRLRPDQVDRIEVELSAPGWWEHLRRSTPRVAQAAGLVHDLRRMIGLLVVHHDLSPARFTAQAMQARGADVAAVAARVEVRCSWRRTLDLAGHLVDVLGPLFAGVDRASLVRAERIMRAHTGAGPLPFPRDLRGLWTVLRARPDRLLDALRHQPGDLAHARLDTLQIRLGADVAVHTTRGGTWPEHRDLPEGSPGWPWRSTVELAWDKWRAGQRRAQARALSTADGGVDAEDWLASLLAVDGGAEGARML